MQKSKIKMTIQKSKILKNISVFLFLFLCFSFLFLNYNKKIIADTLLEPPLIISRAEWGADESLSSEAPEYAEKAEKIIIHHTASATLEPDTDGNGYYKGMIRNIFYYHAVNKTWYNDAGKLQSGYGDIGYNYLIDPNGNIYEGRAGENGVIGAHAQGYNTGSIGISVIGTYGGDINGQYVNNTLTTKSKASLEKLVGWLAANNNISIKTQSLFKDKLVYGVFGHKDVASTQCPGDNIYTSLAQIRTNADTLALSYSNYAYQIPNGSDYYILKNGSRITFNSLDELKNYNPNYKLASINQNQMQAYKTSNVPKYADGSLLREVNTSNIYLLENGKKRLLQITAEEFTELGLKWTEVKDILTFDLAYYAAGLPVKYGKNGKLLADSQNNVYLIEQGKKKLFTSAMLFNILKFSWNKIEKDKNNELNYNLSGGVVSYPNGTLIKGENPTVYVVQEGQKKPITSLTLFNAYKYDWKKLVQTTNAELSSYPITTPLAYPEKSLVKTNNSAVYLVDSQKKKAFTSDYVFENLGYKWQDVLTISQDELNTHADGGQITYSDGTLLQAVDGYKVYVLENGQKKWIQTAEEFTSKGYKWSNIKLTLSSDLDIYPDFENNNQKELSSVVPVPNNNTSVIPAEAGIQSSTMKVSLGSFTQNILISANNGGYKVYENDQLIATKKTGEIYTVAVKNNLDLLFVPDSSSAIMVIYGQDGFTYGQAHPFHSGYGGVTDNRFRGSIRLKYSANSNTYWIINELPMESYLNGVAEANNLDNAEYLKTFSIMIRSYTKHYVDKGGKHPNEPFYLKNSLNGNGNDQVYKGYGFEERAPNATAANASTAGIIATYNGEAIRAAYSSDSGGATWDARKPHYVYYSNGKLVHTSEKPNTSNYYTVWTGGDIYTDFPYLFGGMPDPAGTVHDNSKVVISHGVGVSTTGARKMAENGKTYEEILKYYYPGIKISSN